MKRAPATDHATAILTRFAALDRALVACGFPTTSPWWRATIERYYRSGARQLVVRAGRRAGKSSTLCRLAVVEALWGQHRIPPGDVGTVAIVSTTREEAGERVRTIKAILDALHVAYKPCDGGVETASLVTRRPVRFKVFPASVSGVVGFTAIAVLCDEVSRWRDTDSGVNPATQVLASLRPTMATQPEARIVLSSSPLSILDAHYDAFEQGDSAFQLTAYAPTWEANPTLSEVDTRALEPDETIWRREYLALPSAEVDASLLTAAELDAVTRKAPVEVPWERGHSYIAAMDPAWKHDAWTLAIATSKHDGTRLRRVVVSCRQWQGSKAVPLDPDRVLKDIAAHLATYRLDHVWTDQAADVALRAIAVRHDLATIISPSTAATNLERAEQLRTLVRDKVIELPPLPEVRADLLGVRKRITRAGVGIDIPRVNGRHCDYFPPIALLASKGIPDPEQFGPAPGTPEYARELERKVEENAQRQWEERRREAEDLALL